MCGGGGGKRWDWSDQSLTHLCSTKTSTQGDSVKIQMKDYQFFLCVHIYK